MNQCMTTTMKMSMMIMLTRNELNMMFNDVPESHYNTQTLKKDPLALRGQRLSNSKFEKPSWNMKKLLSLKKVCKHTTKVVNRTVNSFPSSK